MPIYEYKCTNCSHEMEAFQSMSEDPLKKCPDCGRDALQKAMLSAPNFQLKGTGWYKTDYAKKPEPKTDTKSDSKSGGE